MSCMVTCREWIGNVFQYIGVVAIVTRDQNETHVQIMTAPLHQSIGAKADLLHVNSINFTFLGQVLLYF